MRLLALFAIVLLGVYATACGSASKSGSSASNVASETITAHGGPAGAASRPTPSGGFLNDGDQDPAADSDGDSYTNDGDRDPFLDRPGQRSSYHDADDWGFLTYGHAASAVQERAVAAVVGRYFAAAAAGDGAGACTRLTRRLARSVPVDYGLHGPSYLRAGKTCAAVMVLLFEHSHVGEGAVTRVRIEGNIALALFGSRTTLPGYIIVQREGGEGGAWRIAQLLSNQLV